MFHEEFKRLIKSKISMIIFILLIISAISFFMSYSEKQMFIEQLNNDFSADLNRTALKELVNSYTGLKFLFDFWFNSDFAQISMFILYIWAGIFLSPIFIVQKENGFGNMIILRKSYKFATLNVFAAQSLYIFLVLNITTVLQVILSVAFGGFGTSVSIGEYQLNIALAIVIILIQTSIMAIHTILANGIALFFGSIIKNKYIIQALPILFFALFPMLMAATIGNLSSSFANIIIYFEPNNVVNIVSNIFQSSFDNKEILYNILPSFVYIIVLILAFVIDTRKNSRNYV